MFYCSDRLEVKDLMSTCIGDVLIIFFPQSLNPIEAWNPITLPVPSGPPSHSFCQELGFLSCIGVFREEFEITGDSFLNLG